MLTGFVMEYLLIQQHILCNVFIPPSLATLRR